MAHAIAHAVVVAEQDDGKVLYLGPDPPGTSWRLCRYYGTTEARS